MNWFRVYHDIIDDPKVLSLPRAARWHIIELFAVSSRQGFSKLNANSTQTQRGQLPSIQQIAIHMRLSLKKTKEVIQLMIDHGFIDASEDWSVLAIHGWENRQFKSDDVNERVKRFRNVTEPEDETFQKRPRGRDTDTDTETETEQKKSPTPLGQATKVAVIRIPFLLPDWIPGSNWADFEASRKAGKHPLTDGARRKIIAKLDRFRAQGHDPGVLLDLAVERDWRSVFLPDERFGPVPTAANGTHVPSKPKRTPEEQEALDVAAARNCR